MYQQSPIPYRKPIPYRAMEGSQKPKGPYGVAIAAPRPSRPVNLEALNFCNRPPATPVERWINNYSGPPSMPSRAPANVAAFTYFPVSALFDCCQLVVVVGYLIPALFILMS